MRRLYERNRYQRNIKSIVTIFLACCVYLCCCGFTYDNYACRIRINDESLGNVDIYVSDSTAKYLVLDEGHIVNEKSTSSNISGYCIINNDQYTIYFPYCEDIYYRYTSGNSYTYNTYTFTDYEIISTTIDFENNSSNINYENVAMCMLGGLFICAFIGLIRRR